MHRVLVISEMIRIIARHLPPKEQRKMALLCRTFHDPVMDELWHTIESISILIECLPPGLVERIQFAEPGSPTLRITRIPDPSDWDRVRVYARRVRVLLTGPHDVLSAECCRLIEMHYPERCLLPNLQRYHLGDGQCAEGSTLFLMRPSVQHIHYKIPSSHHQRWHLERIAKYSPSLRTLGLSHIDDCKCVSETGRCIFRGVQAGSALSGAILSFRSLTEVRFSTYFEYNAVLHLSRLPHLASLGLQLFDANCKPLVAAAGSVPFPALSVLEVGVKDAAQLALWLRSLCNSPLKTLSVSVSTLPPIPAVEELFDAVSCFAGLRHLYIRTEMAGSSANALNYPADQAILAPLHRKLPLIEEFTLSGLPCHPARRTVIGMALGWPCLRKLRIHWTCYTRPNPASERISPRDLLLLARHCPSIDTVAVPLSKRIGSRALSVYKPGDFDDEAVAVTVDPESGLIVPVSRFNQADKSDAAALAHAMEHTPLTVSNLRILEISEPFRSEEYQEVAGYFAKVFPRVQLDVRPHRKQPRLAKCASTVMDLMKAYIQSKQLNPFDVADKPGKGREGLPGL